MCQLITRKKITAFITLYYIYLILFTTLPHNVLGTDIHDPGLSSRELHQKYYFKSLGLKSNSKDDFYKNTRGLNQEKSVIMPEILLQLEKLPEKSKSLLLTGVIEERSDFFENIVYMEDNDESRVKLNNTLNNTYERENIDSEQSEDYFSFHTLGPTYYKRSNPTLSIQNHLSYYIHPLLLIADFIETNMNTESILITLDSIKLMNKSNLDYNTKKHKENSEIQQRAFCDDNSIEILNNIVNKKRTGTLKLIKKLVEFGLNIDLVQKYPEIFTNAVRKSNYEFVEFYINYLLEKIKVDSLHSSKTNLSVSTNNNSGYLESDYNTKVKGELLNLYSNNSDSEILNNHFMQAYFENPPAKNMIESSNSGNTCKHLSDSKSCESCKYYYFKDSINKYSELLNNLDERDLYFNKTISRNSCYPKSLQLLVNLVDRYNHTPLYYAVKKNDIKMVKILLKYGSYINICDPRSGYSPLMLAVQNHNGAMLSFLLNNGGDPMLISPTSEEDVLDVAIAKNDRKLIERIINHEAYGKLCDNKKSPEIFKYLNDNFSYIHPKSDCEVGNYFFLNNVDIPKDAKHILHAIQSNIPNKLLKKLLNMEEKKKVATLCQITDKSGRGVLWWSVYHENISQVQNILDFYEKATKNRWEGYLSCNPHKEDENGIYPLNLIITRSSKFPRKLVTRLLKFKDPMTHSSLLLQVLTKSKQQFGAFKNLLDFLRNHFNISLSSFNIWSDDPDMLDPIGFALFKQLPQHILSYLLELALEYASEFVEDINHWRIKTERTIRATQQIHDIALSKDTLYRQDMEHNKGEYNKSNLRQQSKTDNINNKQWFLFRNSPSTHNIYDNTKQSRKSSKQFQGRWKSHIVNKQLQRYKVSYIPISLPLDSTPLRILSPTLSSILITKKYTEITDNYNDIIRVIIGRGPTHRSVMKIRELLRLAVGLGTFHFNSYGAEGIEDKLRNIESRETQNKEPLLYERNKDWDFQCLKSEQLYKKRLSISFSTFSPYLISTSPSYTSKIGESYIYPFGEASLDVIHSIAELRPETIGEVLVRIDYSYETDCDRVLALLEALPEDFPPFSSELYSPLERASTILYKYNGKRNILPVIKRFLSHKYIKLFTPIHLTESLNILALIEFVPSSFLEMIGGTSSETLLKHRGVEKEYEDINLKDKSYTKFDMGDLQYTSETKYSHSDIYENNTYFNGKIPNTENFSEKPEISIKLKIIHEIRNIRNLPWSSNLDKSDILFCVLCLMTLAGLFVIYFNISYKIALFVSKRLYYFPEWYFNINMLDSEGLRFALLCNIPRPSDKNIKVAFFNALRKCFFFDPTYKIENFPIFNKEDKFTTFIGSIKLFFIISLTLWYFICKIYEEVFLFIFFTITAIVICTFHSWRINEVIFYQLNIFLTCKNSTVLPEVLTLLKRTNNQIIYTTQRAIFLYNTLTRTPNNIRHIFNINNSTITRYNINKLENSSIGQSKLNLDFYLSDHIPLFQKTQKYEYSSKYSHTCFRILFGINIICFIFSFIVTLKIPTEWHKRLMLNGYKGWFGLINEVIAVFRDISNKRKLYIFQYPNIYQVTLFYPYFVSFINFLTFLYYWQIFSIITAPLFSVILVLYHFFALSLAFKNALHTPTNILLPNARNSKLLMFQTLSNKTNSENLNTPKKADFSQTSTSQNSKKDLLSSKLKIFGHLFPDNSKCLTESRSVRKLKIDSVEHDITNIPNISKGETKKFYDTDSLYKVKSYNYIQDSNDIAEELYLNVKEITEESLLYSNDIMKLKKDSLMKPYLDLDKLVYGQSANSAYELLENDCTPDSMNIINEIQSYNFNHSPFNSNILNLDILSANAEISYYQILEAQIYPFFLWADVRRSSYKIYKQFWKPLDIVKDMCALIFLFLIIILAYVELSNSPIKTIKLWDTTRIAILSLSLVQLYIMYIMVSIHKLNVECWKWVPDIFDVLPICSNLLDSVETLMRMLHILTSPLYILNIPITILTFCTAIILIVIPISVIL
ncbi:uncharacterized protein CMU_018900 [Cryptosporidium muris RN66]|uniref:Uncharacterized protein n=1 Tax=Cryptosporidium muris (strain RN66) TaxID=441375 RepID=B6AC77_CRYMR|nr:uncharacterized protein CMU_018900 [Cryptosporidium muris RN66]EEA06133.1 hypothetical protein, conserved [Cryptosporidium muris RN66]|eukprot:XP_002140482.1 hypothetical protein [Cryptosporidium muris RN66]